MMCLLKFIWLDVDASLLEGFLGITAESGTGLAALKVCELLSRPMLACSRAIVFMRKTALEEISYDEQIFIVPISRVCKWWQDKFLDLCIPFRK